MTNNDDERIAQRAYYLWEQSGRPDGHDVDIWLEAEAQIDGENATPWTGDDARFDTPADRLDSAAKIENSTPAGTVTQGPGASRIAGI